jgi:hypothetical protein
VLGCSYIDYFVGFTSSSYGRGSFQILGCFAADGPELRDAFIRVKLIEEELVVSVKLEAV